MGVLTGFVQLNLTKLATKKSWHSMGGQQLLVVSACTEHPIVASCLSMAVHSGLCGISGWFVSVLESAYDFCLPEICLDCLTYFLERLHIHLIGNKLQTGKSCSCC